MKLLILLCAVFASGCSSTNISELVKATANDSATVTAHVNSIYGTAWFTRTNPGTNQTVTVSPDGTVTIGTK